MWFVWESSPLSLSLSLPLSLSPHVPCRETPLNSAPPSESVKRRVLSTLQSFSGAPSADPDFP